MIEAFDKFLPFGQYLYLYVRDGLEDFKRIIKNFLIIRLEKKVDSEKILSINVLDLLDLYNPPFNALLVVKVIGQNEEEKFLLEVSNYPYEVFPLYENGVGIFVMANDKLVVEFYALDDRLFLEGVKRFKKLYKEKGAIGAIEDINNELKDLSEEIGYEITSKMSVEKAEIAKKFIQLLNSLIIEEEAT